MGQFWKNVEFFLWVALTGGGTAVIDGMHQVVTYEGPVDMQQVGKVAAMGALIAIVNEARKRKQISVALNTPVPADPLPPAAKSQAAAGGG